MKEHQNAIHMSYRSLLGLQAIQNAYVKRNKALADPAHRGFASHPRVEWPTSRGPRTTPKPGQAAEPIIGKVGILGAGAAGLYAAMILQSMGIDYEILEAQNVPGGRLHTHYFEPGANASNNYGNFQYYDVGAMRYPNIPIMERTFDLFSRVQFTTANGKLIPYYLDSETGLTPQLYNNIQWPAQPPLHSWETPAPPPDPPTDYFKVGTANGGPVNQTDVATGVGPLLDAAYDEYKLALAENWKAGWVKLMGADKHSTRAYLAQPPLEIEVSGQKILAVEGLDYDFDTIQWCETNDTATGLYDQAFSESIMDSLDFGWPSASREGGPPHPKEAEVEWKCIKGGSSTLVQAMLAKLDQTKLPIYNRRVTRIAGVKNPLITGIVDSVNVDTTDGTFSAIIPKAGKRPQVTTKNYAYVLSSLPLSALAQGVDTNDAGFDYQQLVAIRSLHYDGSVKVGIRFKEQWWRKAPYSYRGGRSSTDQPIRTCVYPSYGQNETLPTNPGVLIASYTWAQDAFRIGSMVRGSNFQTHTYPNGPEDDLIENVLRDLAELHLIPIETLRGLYQDHYAHDWYDDSAACGAFALFGPGQFSEMYPSMIRPAALNPRLHLIGEATSVHHAWVVGSLNSAWRGVYNILKAAGCTNEDSRIVQLMTKPVEGDGGKNWGPAPNELFLPTVEKHGPLPRIPTPAVGDGVAYRDWWDIFTPAKTRGDHKAVVKT